MRRGMTVLAILVTVALALLPAGSSLATTSATTSAVWTAGDVDEERVIPVGWRSHYEAYDCIQRHACEHLEGVAFVTLDISEPMEQADDRAVFYVTNGLRTAAVTLWYVVGYDGDGNAIEDWRDDQRAFGLKGEMDPSTRELRLFPVQSAPTEYHLRVYT